MIVYVAFDSSFPAVLNDVKKSKMKIFVSSTLPLVLQKTDSKLCFYSCQRRLAWFVRVMVELSAMKLPEFSRKTSVYLGFPLNLHPLEKQLFPIVRFVKTAHWMSNSSTFKE